MSELYRQDDIVDRLRWAAGSGTPLQCCTAMLLAADEIERLREALATSRELREFDTGEIARLRLLLAARRQGQAV